MISKLRSIFFLVFIPFTFTYAHITQIDNFSQLEEAISKSDENTLVVFDIDHVLVVSKDQYIHPPAEKVYFKHVDRVKKNYVTHDQKQRFYSIMSKTLTDPVRVLVEENAPQMISNMQQRNIKVVALTSLPTDIFGHLYVERWRVNQLKDLGIDFSPAFPDWKVVTLKDFEKSGTKAPAYHDGVIFAKNFSKGEVLKSFFKQTGFYPNKVIFVDDLKENLESVESELACFNIEVLSFHYLGARTFYKPVCEATIEHQVDHLIQKEEWLSDEQVAEKLGL